MSLRESTGVNFVAPSVKHSNLSDFVISGKVFSKLSTHAIHLDKCRNVIIEDCVMTDILNASSPVCAIYLTNCANVSISGCSFKNVNNGVYAIGCSGISVVNNECFEIQRVKPRGQFCQMNSCSGAGNRIAFNYVRNTLGKSSTEDIVSIYKCNGTAESYILVENNAFYGGGPSVSGTGILIGDNGGSFQHVRNNIMVDVGQCGIGMAGGSNMIIENNKIFGKKQPFTNVGIYAWRQKNTNIGDNVRITGNVIGFVNKDGKQNSIWDGKNISNLVIKDNRVSVPYEVPDIPDEVGLLRRSDGVAEQRPLGVIKTPPPVVNKGVELDLKNIERIVIYYK